MEFYIDFSSLADGIIQIINDLATKFGIIIDWSADNIMPYLNVLFDKFIAWKTSTAILFICIAGFLFLVTAALAITDFAIGYADGVLGIFMLIGAVICLVWLCINIYRLIQIQTFPELVAIDYIKSLMPNS